MSRKSKSQTRRAAPAKVEQQQPTFTVTSRPFDRDFNPDYSYVKKDLKRIGALAGSFIMLLIVLSFFIK
ncbi:MAG: hypothetical protein L0Z70_11860 [Chloroflexi bacterium]|nr:hypothetical protein [Chloroflexota bacterium]